MALLLRKNLFLSSLLVILFTSCAPTFKYHFKGVEVVNNKTVKPVVQPNEALLYKAQIKLYNKYFSGLILLKQTTQDTAHLVFVTELGMQMFDFEIANNQLNLKYVFEPLNKPKILSLLAHDMKLILLQYLYEQESKVYENGDNSGLIYATKQDKKTHFYYVNSSTKTVVKSIIKGPLFIKQKVNYTYDKEQKLSKIELKHKGFIRLKIILNKIDK
jgi:hypothetical protein